MRLRPFIAALTLATAGITAAPAPASATISKPCTITWYYNGGGAYKMFARCSTGTQYNAQRAHINCNNGSGVGAWQGQPGPWYGSTATCPSGGHAVGTSYVEFY